jgi:hypothetical protein
VRRIGAAFGILAALGLFSAPASANVLHVKSCHGGFLDLPLKQDGKPGRDKNCAFACHAPLCQDRKRRGMPA